MKKITLLLSFAVLLSASFIFTGTSANNKVFAADELIYDTGNNYLGTCRKTDTTTWTLDKDLTVTTFQIWYYWQSGEGPVSFVLQKDGADFLTGSVTRSACDPYQTSWCNGDLTINKTFPKGSYSLKVATKQQCAIPAGNGIVRLYGPAAGTVTQATPAAQKTNPADTKTDPSLKMIYDTSNHYIGACSLTDTSTWTSTVDMNVTVLQIWYTWTSGETSVPFTLTQDGTQLAKGVLTKTSECQGSWCNGNYTINKVFPKGSTYAVKVGTARQCKDDKGNGVVRLFGSDPATQTVNTTAANQTKTQTQCNATNGFAVPAAAAVGGLLVGAAGAFFLLKKR